MLRFELKSPGSILGSQGNKTNDLGLHFYDSKIILSLGSQKIPDVNGEIKGLQEVLGGLFGREALWQLFSLATKISMGGLDFLKGNSISLFSLFHFKTHQSSLD